MMEIIVFLIHEPIHTTLANTYNIAQKNFGFPLKENVTHVVLKK